MATKKTSLRDFQQDLVERIKGAADQSSSGARLGVQAGAANVLLHLEEAGEVVPLPQVTSVPLTKPFTKDSLLRTVAAYVPQSAA
ncbi:MAG: hypothetical protein NT115_16435 [Proteobacteria bacterium]|nr:hypothetical protein [Pseudomonadota bacterium]